MCFNHCGKALNQSFLLPDACGLHTTPKKERTGEIWDASIHKSPSAYLHQSKPASFTLTQVGAVTTATKGDKTTPPLTPKVRKHESHPSQLQTYLNPSCCVRWHAPIAFCNAQTEASSPSSGTSTRSSTRFPSTGNNSTPHRSVYHSASLSLPPDPMQLFLFPLTFSSATSLALSTL